MDKPVTLLSLADAVQEKSYRFSIDDNIWVFRDIARQRPASLFDNDYLATLYRLHRKHGTRFQLNVYYETEGFNLTQMPDCYREEWAANAGWLRLSFHAKADQPGHPYAGAGYDQVKAECEAVHEQIRRFAGEQSLSYFTTIHFVAATREGCRALQDCGIKGLIALCSDGQGGVRLSYYLDEPAARLLEQNGLAQDQDNGLIFIRNDMVINTVPEEDIRPRLEQLKASDKRDSFVEVMIHEQYFYPDYPYHLPDFAVRMETAILWLRENGYRSVYLEEIV